MQRNLQQPSMFKTSSLSKFPIPVGSSTNSVQYSSSIHCRVLIKVIH
uniref:Uncharacterized protein n=1 Tax=Arundo donax TaxID=35708 RepID=A0A0A9C846_ARUDO